MKKVLIIILFLSIHVSASYAVSFSLISRYVHQVAGISKAEDGIHMLTTLGDIELNENETLEDDSEKDHFWFISALILFQTQHCSFAPASHSWLRSDPASALLPSYPPVYLATGHLTI